MMLPEIDREFKRLAGLVDAGEFQVAYDGGIELLEEISRELKGSKVHHIMLFNLAGLFIDIGGMQPNEDATSRGMNLLTENEHDILEVVKKDAYFYNLSNAASNQRTTRNPFQHSFHSIEESVHLKNLFWKALKYSEHESGSVPPEFKVNLANALRSQFRIVEALSYYDDVNLHAADIYQAWVNRSETLKLLNQVSNSYSIRMLEEIAKGYEEAAKSGNPPPVWRENFQKQAEFHTGKVKAVRKELGVSADENDHAKSAVEYQRLSEYRKFCLKKHLTLSEHALYCQCAGSARDNLTIPTQSGVVGDFVVPMERVLNRLKSEFAFVRHLYYEYVTQATPDEIQHELCFSELLDGEILGLDIEKIRAGFRSCFGILDKIGAAICELYSLHPKNRHIYFNNMWRLDLDGRREKFEAVKNAGLLALYSIATDLNEEKDGEWSFYKGWRDAMEHKFVVVYTGEAPPDDQMPYNFMKDVVFIREEEFVAHFERLLQLTRSAIFSFVFSVREHALAEKSSDALYLTNEISSRNFYSE